ncbi:uncharacterized protein [Thunnus thynnus]|uniref:uncharacterized protein n=1 Tax=Thunnus thynnus TaxID=8237 RepID=UPI00352957EE
MDQSRGLHWDSGGSTESQPVESPKQKSTSGPEFLSLARCAGCYNHQKNSKFRWGDDSESSTSDEDLEADLESEPESSCSSSSSDQVLDEIPEKPATEEPSAVSGDAAEPQSGGLDGDGQVGETSESQEDKKRTKRVIQRAPLVKSRSLPDSFTHHLTPMSLLPRPPRVVSVLNLQVLQQKPDSDTFYKLCRHLPEREEGKTEESKGGIKNPLPPQPFQQWQQGLPGQRRSETTSQQHQYQPQQLPHLHQQPPHQLSHQYQLQQQPQLFSPLLAQGQRLPPPPPPSLPVFPPPTLHSFLQAPTHLHALAPQTCWYCYRTHFPHTCLSNHGSRQLPR